MTLESNILSSESSPDGGMSRKTSIFAYSVQRLKKNRLVWESHTYTFWIVPIKLVAFQQRKQPIFVHTMIKNRNWGKFNSSAMLCGELESDHVALVTGKYLISNCCKYLATYRQLVLIEGSTALRTGQSRCCLPHFCFHSQQLQLLTASHLADLALPWEWDSILLSVSSLATSRRSQ